MKTSKMCTVTRSGYVAGEKVELCPRVSAPFLGHEGPIAESVADDTGTVTFEDVKAGQYWLASRDTGGQRRGVMVVAKIDPTSGPGSSPPPLSPEEIRERLAQTRPVSSAVQTREQRVSGSRSSVSARVKPQKSPGG